MVRIIAGAVLIAVLLAIVAYPCAWLGKLFWTGAANRLSLTQRVWRIATAVLISGLWAFGAALFNEAGCGIYAKAFCDSLWGIFLSAATVGLMILGFSVVSFLVLRRVFPHLR
jgi:hypothetical protein